ncbi:MAG TPA: hypothetical protein VD710_04155 [Nitrososphaeraceae archaeon]|nr:hypothetical protein [Nitrososphaeraceae archaeon]
MSNLTNRKKILMIGTVVIVVIMSGFITNTSLIAAAQEEQDVDVAPAPPSIGVDIPLTYFGPAPSEVNPSFIGPLQLLRSGPVDINASTVTLPLYKGQLITGETVWYVITDTTDKGNAEALGLNWSPKLTYSAMGTRVANVGTNNTLIFENGTVDFGPEHQVTAGEENPFPPAKADPGSRGDSDYTPLVLVRNAADHVYNAPIVASNVGESELDAFCDGNPDYSIVHDKVVKICPKEGTVTLSLTAGFSFARPVLYLSLDASVPLAAALEKATLAPKLAVIAVGNDDSAFSAVERIFVTANGPTGVDNPQRQGLNSAIMGEGSPLNVLGGIPTIATDYSPLWDVNLGEWTKEAIDNGYRSRVTEEFQILGLVQDGWITSPGGGPYGSAGIIVNCPIVFRFL